MNVVSYVSPNLLVLPILVDVSPNQLADPESLGGQS